MTKKSGGAALTTFAVTVTPTAIVPPGSKNVECDITGPATTGNVLFLLCNTAYDITFNLVPGPAGTFAFLAAAPFCNQPQHCPKPLPNCSAHTPCKVTNNGGGNNGISITVHIDPLPSRAVTYYRLNFVGGFTCDPIIINN